MPSLVEVFRPWSRPRAAALTLITIAIAGCSAESTRFSDNPNARVDNTASVPTVQSAPAGQVESRPLPPMSAQAAPPPYSSAPATVATGSGTAGGGRGMASYTPGAPTPAADVTGSVAAAPKPAPSGRWTWEGGTPVTVAPGDTVESISRRHGVPASAITQANNLTPPGTIHPGQQLVIPRYSQSPVASAAPASARAGLPAAKPAPVRSVSSAGGAAGVHVVAPGETLSKISRLYGKSLGDVAKANSIQPGAKLNVGDRLVIPGVRTTAAKPKAGPVLARAQAKPAAAAPKEPASEPAPSASVFTPVAESPAAKESVKSAEGTGSLPKFRWPANGRVIAGFGPTTNGQQNDGINIALPENTPVKAAEDGVVAYAGNELKGYGNLVLVRHPNGYVTAYAHAKELLVKRGDQVKRGQVIARSGQTGNVSAPQLHFEIRKGASPLDPIKFLNGA
jgi:murein DD-endopeptidase MepM/ murein hydrolase activator NlpD